MSRSREPEFDELVGGDLSPAERERLRRVHDLLVAAGPPADVPAEDVEGLTGTNVRALTRPRRRGRAITLLAATLALAAFGAGYFAGDRGDEVDAARVIAMRGVGDFASARASIRIGDRDDSGNLPMVFRVTGLPKVNAEGYYELLLVRGRDRLACGSFVVGEGTTEARFSVYYDVRPSDRWIVAAHPREHLDNPPVALTT